MGNLYSNANLMYIIDHTCLPHLNFHAKYLAYRLYRLLYHYCVTQLDIGFPYLEHSTASVNLAFVISLRSRETCVATVPPQTYFGLTVMNICRSKLAWRLFLWSSRNPCINQVVMIVQLSLCQAQSQKVSTDSVTFLGIFYLYINHWVH